MFPYIEAFLCCPHKMGLFTGPRPFPVRRSYSFLWGTRQARQHGIPCVWGAASQTRPRYGAISWGATSSGQSPHRSPWPDGQVSLRSLAPPLPRKALRAFPGPPDCAPNHVYGHCHPVMWKDGGDGSKTISFSLPEKETVFGIQRKRGSRGGQVAPNRVSAAPLYAPIEDQPRPQWTTQAEQGRGPIPHFFAACAGGNCGVVWRAGSSRPTKKEMPFPTEAFFQRNSGRC